MMIDFGRPDEKEKLLHRYSKFFESLSNLQNAVDKIFNRNNTLMERADILISVLGNICFENFSAILLLSVHGFGDDAYSLSRGMYERLVLSRHFHLHPDDVDAFWDFHLVKLRKLGLEDLLHKLDLLVMRSTVSWQFIHTQVRKLCKEIGREMTSLQWRTRSDSANMFVTLTAYH